MLLCAQGPGDLDFLTWLPTTDTGSVNTLMTGAFSGIAAYLDAHRAVLLQERIFGCTKLAEAVLGIRNTVYDHLGPALTVPPTYIEGKSCNGSKIAGIHAIAVRPDADADEPQIIRWQGEPVGVVVQGKDSAYLGLSNVSRLLSVAHCRQPGTEAQELFTLLERLLDSIGWSFGDIVRTWFYLDDILSWYDEFNRVRNEAFTRAGLLGASAKGVMPASTGILGRVSTGNWCGLDLIGMKAVNGYPLDIKRLINPKQNEAPEYGSSFSRGLAVTTRTCEYLFVSGTASIDTNGISTNLGSFERQTRETLTTVESLIAPAGARLENLCQATAFLKTPDNIPVYERLASTPALAAVCTIADVCRDELLFELDGTGVMPAWTPHVVTTV